MNVWVLTGSYDPTEHEVVGAYSTLNAARAASPEPLTYPEGDRRWSSRDGSYVVEQFTVDAED